MRFQDKTINVPANTISFHGQECPTGRMDSSSPDIIHRPEKDKGDFLAVPP
jgi:hypothetical protein